MRLRNLSEKGKQLLGKAGSALERVENLADKPKQLLDSSKANLQGLLNPTVTVQPSNNTFMWIAAIIVLFFALKKRK